MVVTYHSPSERNGTRETMPECRLALSARKDVGVDFEHQNLEAPLQVEVAYRRTPAQPKRPRTKHGTFPLKWLRRQPLQTGCHATWESHKISLSPLTISSLLTHSFSVMLNA